MSIEERLLFRAKIDRMVRADAQPYVYTPRSHKSVHCTRGHVCEQSGMITPSYTALEPMLRKHSQLVCAGGYVWRGIHACGCANDTDLYIVDTSSDAYVDKCTRANAILHDCLQMIVREHGPCDVLHTRDLITVQVCSSVIYDGTGGFHMSPYAHTIKYQFVLRIYDNVGDLLRGFDLSLSQVAMSCVGGNMRLRATELGAWSCDRRVCIVDPLQMHPRTYERACKYCTCAPVVLVGIVEHTVNGFARVQDYTDKNIFAIGRGRLYGAYDHTTDYRQSSGMTYLRSRTEQTARNLLYLMYDKDAHVGATTRIDAQNVFKCTAPIYGLFDATRWQYPSAYMYVSEYGWEGMEYYYKQHNGMDQWELMRYVEDKYEAQKAVIAEDLSEVRWRTEKYELAEGKMHLFEQWVGVKYGNRAMERFLRLARRRYPFSLLPKDVFLIVLQLALVYDSMDSVRTLC